MDPHQPPQQQSAGSRGTQHAYGGGQQYQPLFHVDFQAHPQDTAMATETQPERPSNPYPVLPRGQVNMGFFMNTYAPNADTNSQSTAPDPLPSSGVAAGSAPTSTGIVTGPGLQVTEVKAKRPREPEVEGNDVPVAPSLPTQRSQSSSLAPLKKKTKTANPTSQQGSQRASQQGSQHASQQGSQRATQQGSQRASQQGSQHSLDESQGRSSGRTATVTKQIAEDMLKAYSGVLGRLDGGDSVLLQRTYTESPSLIAVLRILVVWYRTIAKVVNAEVVDGRTELLEIFRDRSHQLTECLHRLGFLAIGPDEAHRLAAIRLATNGEFSHFGTVTVNGGKRKYDDDHWIRDKFSEFAVTKKKEDWRQYVKENHINIYNLSELAKLSPNTDQTSTTSRAPEDPHFQGLLSSQSSFKAYKAITRALPLPFRSAPASMRDDRPLFSIGMMSLIHVMADHILRQTANGARVEMTTWEDWFKLFLSLDDSYQASHQDLLSKVDEDFTEWLSNLATLAVDTAASEDARLSQMAGEIKSQPFNTFGY